MRTIISTLDFTARAVDRAFQDVWKIANQYLRFFQKYQQVQLVDQMDVTLTAVPSMSVAVDLTLEDFTQAPFGGVGQIGVVGVDVWYNKAGSDSITALFVLTARSGNLPAGTFPFNYILSSSANPNKA